MILKVRRIDQHVHSVTANLISLDQEIEDLLLDLVLVGAVVVFLSVMKVLVVRGLLEREEVVSLGEALVIESQVVSLKELVATPEKLLAIKRKVVAPIQEEVSETKENQEVVVILEETMGIEKKVALVVIALLREVEVLLDVHMVVIKDVAHLVPTLFLNPAEKESLFVLEIHAGGLRDRETNKHSEIGTKN